MSVKKKKQKLSLSKSKSNTSNKKSNKKKGGSTPISARHSGKTPKRGSGFFPDNGNTKMMQKAISDYELEVKKLKRENQVMAAQLKKLQNTSGKKTKYIEKEKNMRVAANKERHWLKQKLSRMQMAIEARLKMLGIDFSNCNDLSEALEAAFAAIQKLAAELAKKEKELTDLTSEKEGMMEDQENMQKMMDKLNNKIKKQQRALDEQKKQLNDRDRRLSLMGNEKKKEKGKTSEYEKELERLRATIEKLKKGKEKQFDDFVDKKADMDSAMRKQQRDMDKLKKESEVSAKEFDKLKQSNEKLMQNLNKKQDLIDKLEDKLIEAKENTKEEDERHRNEIEEAERNLRKVDDENDELRKIMNELEERMKKMQDKIDAQDEEGKRLRDDLEGERKKNEEAKQRAKQLEKDNSDELNKMQDEKSSLMNLMKKQQENIKEQKSNINDLKQELKEALGKLKDTRKDYEKQDKEMRSMKDALDKLNEEMKSKEQENSDKDDEISRLLQELERTKKALKTAEDKIKKHLDKERDVKQVQTTIDMNWFNKNQMTINEIDDIKEENEKLRELAHKNDDRLDELADENKGLLDEIDLLLKQQAQFRQDSSNHRGEILSMCVSPCKYIVATTATDKTVRLWKIKPDQEKSSKQVEIYACARMEGNALSLAFTNDGSYLVAGCAYKNGPDGLLMIWDMTKGDGSVAFLFRSRPSIRFGKAYCVCWSTDAKYIYSGDTTGTIWVWDTQRMLLLAEYQAHKDIVHDVSIAGDILFSCSLDQTVSSFDTMQLDKVRVKKNKVHLHVPKKFKGVKQDQNDKYPYWKINCTKDKRFIVSGSRKVMVWTFDGKSFSKGPRITDTDLDHIKMLDVVSGKVIICRLNTKRSKIFDLQTGKEFKVAKYKQIITQVGICHDKKHAILCLQSMEKKHAKPCKMVLWKWA